MEQLNQYTKLNPGFILRQDLKFEKHFNTDFPTEKIRFARHYVENNMGYDLDEDSLIDFSTIGIKLFGCLVADIVLEYENYKDKGLDG